ncbi:hypothetical protein BV20DRAFT_1056669 [Pilatotrama ljubarskyi]|nr:hypothetical protein BV20DRAFT_1056669 [Pilatotrama ljubarskyi]
MSSTQDGLQAAEIADLIASLTSSDASNYCGVSALVLVVDDHLVNLDREIAFFWRRKASGASVLYFLNRYNMLHQSAWGVAALARLSETYVPWAGEPPKSCLERRALSYRYLAFAALRVLALSAASPRGFNHASARWSVMMLVLLLSLVPVGVNIYGYVLTTAFNDPLFGCSGVINLSTSVIRNLTSIIISRMLLNLQEVNQDPVTDSGVGDGGDGVTTSINFARVIGSLGSAVVCTGGTAAVDFAAGCGEESGSYDTTKKVKRRL